MVPLALIAPLHLSTGAYAVGPTSQRVSTSLYGKAGLVDMPNALFFDAGHLSMTGMLKYPDDRITLNFQPLPWFEAAFRYVIIEGFDSHQPQQSDRFDRSFDFKLKILDQGPWWPAVAAGMQDFVGSGLYSSEYVVSTWQTTNFNFTAGIGFGRLASRGTVNNPFGKISSQFYSRAVVTNISETGQTLSNQYFRGPDMGIFGGVEYLTPVKGLKLTAEYSSDAYTRERNRGIAIADFPFNFGASYRLGDNMEFGASLVQGDTFAVRFTIQTNPITQSTPPRLDVPRFRFRSRGEDPVPQVKPFAGQNELYQQYSAVQNREQSTASLAENRDHISAASRWNPWGKQDRIDRRRDDAEYADRDYLPIPESVDVEWISLVQDATVVTNIDTHPASGDTASQWHFANWSDEVPDMFQTIETLNGTNNTLLAQYQAPSIKDREAVARARAKVWSWPLNEDDKALIAESIRDAASTQGIATVAVEFEDTKLTLYYYNGKYHREAEAIGRLLAILTQAAPDRIEQFGLVAVINDLQVSKIQIPRGSLERIVSNDGSPQELYNVAAFSEGPRSRPPNLILDKGWMPTIDYGLAPSFRYSIFDPDDPMRYQIAALLVGSVGLYDGLSLAGIYRLNIYDNFDEIKRGAGSLLPRVRTNFAKYLNTSEHSLEMLALNYHLQPARNWYARTYIGYLEEMYAGLGVETLYRPYGKRWALGLEVDYVQQRDFDRGLRLRDYKTVTGFAKWYYEVPYEDLQLELNVGRYLAKDVGATFKVSRRFDNGTEIGAFATLTDVPFRTFGEGSFDKGIIIKIPFHTFAFFDSKRIYSTIIRPLTRDGGAQVWSGTTLYDTTQQISLGDIRRNWGAVFE